MADISFINIYYYIKTRRERVKMEDIYKTEKSYFQLLKFISTLKHNAKLISSGARILLSTPEGMQYQRVLS